MCIHLPSFFPRSYTRLDGATPQAKREAALVDFGTKRSVRVMIISLKAG
jgi:SNF2 family DNA or RNA helicase